ncbi:MAG: glutathione peroxidase, partial [Bacteroidetes bacterium]|nr:glutathione peroxidase [Bacteroidota bacterium]
LQDQHKDRLVVLGFPANNFGGQEPGSDSEIKAFCQKNYGVQFPMFSKISVAGSDKHPLYQWLSSKEKNGWNEKSPNWNFCKYLIDENGELVGFYSSAVKPLSEEIVSHLK